MSKQERLDQLLAHVETKAALVAMTDDEYLRRVRLQIQGLCDAILTSAPAEEEKLIRKMRLASTLEEMAHEIEEISAIAEDRFPGITSTIQILIKKEAELSARVERKA